MFVAFSSAIYLLLRNYELLKFLEYESTPYIISKKISFQ